MAALEGAPNERPADGRRDRKRRQIQRRGTAMAKEPAQRRPKSATVETRDPDEFASVLKQSFKPRSERAATEVENAVTTLVQQALADTSLDQGRRPRHDRGDDRAPRREAVGAGERDHPRAGVPADRERLARPALPRLQLRDRRDPEDPGHERLARTSSTATCGSIPARAGTRARCSRRSTRPNSASSAASRTAA